MDSPEEIRGTYERRHKRKEVRIYKEEICERGHKQSNKRGHQRRTVKRHSFGENGGGSRGDMWKRTLLGTQLETRFWKKQLHAMRTNASERTAVMGAVCCNRDTPDGLRPWMTCQSRDSPEGTAGHRRTYASTEEQERKRSSGGVLDLHEIGRAHV